MTVVAIVGPTATGKSALGMAVARAAAAGATAPAEIVSVDSMQVYRGMDVGTAKPSPADRRAVPHHLVDIVEPTEDFSVARFQRELRPVLEDIRRRDTHALLVGGTGLYVRAAVDGLAIPSRWPGVRAELDAEPDTTALHRRLQGLDPLAATRMEPTNRRRIVRALEVTIGSGRPFSDHGDGLTAYPPTDVVVVGLTLERDQLTERIAARFHRMLDDGFLEEVVTLADRHGPRLSRTARQALGYRELLRHVEDGEPLDAVVDEAIRRTRTFAVRQERWFRRDPRIHWLDATRPLDDLVAHVLARLEPRDRQP
jgi:tRNA dimethylallyltransferase